MPTFQYLVMAACVMDDIPLMLLDTRRRAEWQLLKLMKKRKNGTLRLSTPSELCYFYIIEFKEGSPYQILTENIIDNNRIELHHSTQS